jgi:hypothetical protein
MNEYTFEGRNLVRKELERSKKRPYHPPEIRVYGTVLELTAKKGLRGNRDGGSFPKTRTHV